MALPTTTRTPLSDIDSFFDQMLGDWGFPRVEIPSVTLPALDLYEKDGKYVAEVSVPGYKTDDINVEVNGHVLTISGKYGESTDTRDAKYHRREIRRGSFSRSVSLPQELDQNSVTAKVDRGILKVIAAPAKPIENKKIPISG
jgi:HSP20 family protein